MPFPLVPQNGMPFRITVVDHGGPATSDASGAPVNRTATLSHFLANAATLSLDEETEELAALHLLDTLASIVACRDLEPAVVARRYVQTNAGSAGAGGATILGTTDRAPIVDAIFAGAMTAHSAEINDFMPAVFVQPGPAVVATAMAVGERRRSTRDELLRAIVAGYDLAFRVPLAVGSDNLRRAGVASHGVGPGFGAAAAAAVLLGLPERVIADVLSLTAEQAAGSWQWLLDVEHMEKAFVFAGLGARNGAQAALLVEAGFRGVPDVVDREGTWFTSAAFTRPDGDGDLDALVEGLGTSRALRASAFKRHPVGGPTQPAVQALLELRPGFGPDDVRRVVIEMPGRWQAFRDAAMPALNLRYLTAIILLDGRLDFVAAQSLERRWGDAAVLALMERVDVRHDPEQEAGAGEARTESARVTVELRDGRRLERFVPHVVGFPSHPMPAAEVAAKARELVTPQLGAARAGALVEACLAVDGPGAADLVALLA
jgi:2-methylcitrate dehydratase PrpD